MDLEAKDARHIGVFWRRRDSLWVDVGEEMGKGSAKVCAIDICARSVNGFGIIEILTAEAKEFDEGLAGTICLANGEE